MDSKNKIAILAVVFTFTACSPSSYEYNFQSDRLQELKDRCLNLELPIDFCMDL